MYRTLLISGLTLALLAACATYEESAYDTDQNFLAFDHPFTDKAAADVLARARTLCAQQQKVPLQTTNVCSLQQCNTSYQCVKKVD